MTARRNTYLEIYATRTPRYDDRPAGRLPGAVVVLTVAVLTLLVMAPEVVTWLTGLAASVLASLG